MQKIAFFICFLFGISGFSQNSWKNYTTVADSLDLKLQFEESLHYRKNALESAQNQPDSIQKLLLGLQMFTQAETDFNQTKKANPEAYELMQKAVENLKETNTSPERISKTYRRLAENAFDYMYKREDAEKHIEKAFEYFDKTTEKDIIYQIEMMIFSGYVKALSRKYEEAIDISEKALKLFEQIDLKSNNDLELKARIYYNLSLVYNFQFLDIPSKEYEYTVVSEQVLNKIDSPDIEHIILTQRRLALFEKDFGNYPKAKGYINKAMALYEKYQEEMRTRVGFKLEMALHRAYIMIFYESEEEKEALKSLEKVEQVVQNNEIDEVEKGLYKGILNDITTYSLIAENLLRAKKYNDRALSIHLDSNKAPYSLESYNQRTKILEAQVCFSQNNYNKTIEIIANIEKETGHISRSFGELKAKTLLNLNQYEEAVITINELLRSFEKDNQNFNFPESDVTNFTSGYVIRDSGGLIELAKAFREYYGAYCEEEEKLYWIALAQFENNIGNTPLNKELKKHFDKIVSGLINASLEREFSNTENNHLLSFMERVSSQDLINTFLLKREIAGNTQRYKTIEDEQYTRAYITYLKKEFQQTKDENIKQQLFEKERELEKINEQITLQYQQNNPFSVPNIDITTNIDKNIIKFKVTDDHLYKIRWFDGKLTYDKIDDYPSVKQEIESYLTNINNLNISVNELKQQGESLYNKLFTNDFDTLIPTVIIPDDVLHYLPFDILVKNGQYLIENHTISYASNFYFLNSKNMLAEHPKSTKVVFFAPEYSGEIPESQLAVRGETYSLEGAKEEVNQLSKLISGEVFKGSSASKSQFKSLEKDVSVLHLAMHSNLNDEDPELSNLIFSNSEQDYEMYISELYGLSFNADLAVLSACNTGVGGFKDGGNLVSMHNAFTTAGIPATVASLWNAPDLSTKEVMVEFYKNLQKGQNKASALQNAKLNYLKNTKDENMQHPFYWAGFILSGDESPVQLTGKPFWKRPIVGIIALSVVVIFSVSFFMRKRK